MNLEEVKKRTASMLLKELQRGVREWYYVSNADSDRFLGGYLVQAFGPTDAWRIYHAMNWHQPGSTATYGPLDPDSLVMVPEEQKWCRLTREEVLTLGG